MEELRFSEYCANCRKSLEHVEKILFVEKEVGRCFCCEECIQDYFQPTVDFMREELIKLRSDFDVPEADYPKYAHYRSLTLGDPDEVWLDEVESGERHFTFITHFRKGEEQFAYVVICLAIEGEPSFVFLSFPTHDEDLVDEYRRGQDMRVGQEEPDAAAAADVPDATPEHPPQPDSESSVFERLYADLRKPDDIPADSFPRYEAFVEPTLDEPDEIWKLVDDEGNEWCTFMARQTADDAEEFTMIVVCQPDLEEGGRLKSFEVVFAFPTIDPGLVQHFRKGINSLNKTFGVGWTRGRAA
jgi:hypothetical protein